MDDDQQLRRAGELISETAAVALAVSNPLAFGRKLVDILLRLHAQEPVPGLADYFLDWLNDIYSDLRAHEQRLFRLEADRGKLMLIGSYGEHAWREACDQRRRMLGDAVLGVVFSDLTVSELGRAERTIRLLDSADLQLLREIRQVWDRTQNAQDAVSTRDDTGRIVSVQRDEDGRIPHPPGACHGHLINGHLAGAALLASGCVQHMPSQGVSFAPQELVCITPLGDLLLRFMGYADHAR